MVLACGHIFCHGCLDRIWGNDRKEKRKLACPVCKAEMQCQHCGKKARVVAIPILFYNAETPKRVPLTLPEGAGERAVMELRQLFGEDSVANPREVEIRKLYNEIMDDLDKGNNGVPRGQDEIEKHFMNLVSKSYRGLWRLRDTFIRNKQRECSETDLWQ
ncbi:hypothetical protein BBK36DRAFT_4442 [Trichoderma citrinoviride]|uniref:RING-type domain-containing protein n=1 Tax=Trichoderma citrinoviride TaxID=58853 RepID=A0A2T4BA40_9HYPO|nr:hypothetical protein BBK36DRAFT_4442 [Trichoderma citrinoviride]PTB66186.1 hypothetical protein BBK36DRAFT_4442 [Trichoderma citrinoviride]